jgi:hypothetical protein
MIDLLKNISQDHFQNKLSQVFLINNFFHVTSSLKQLSESSALVAEDTATFDKVEQVAIQKYI